ncbi:hypothetical protein [Brevundimonas sp.]|uniref:hypothetical protein n=1 Tax=Brevundimonas sp. TaxID=1871086 RepID=UPI0025EC4798|nr:hypothetical protein [Brevundimonas sp.]
MSQLDLFGGATPQALAQVDPEAVRRRVNALLDRLRAAEVMPLSDKELRYWTTVMPQTTNWLEPDEKAAACAEFEAQVTRLSRQAA